MNSSFRFISFILFFVSYSIIQPARAQKLLDAVNAGGPISVVGNTSGGANATVVLAYSVRQLKTNYDHATITAPATVSGFSNASTPLLRVRRSTDNGQLDIGYTASGLIDTAALKTFVTDNGASPTASGFVSIWYDQSGNSRDAFQTTNALQFRIVNAGVVEKNENNIPAAVDAGGFYMYDTATLTKPYSITGNHTISVVAQPKSYTGTGGTQDGLGTYLNDHNGITNGLSSMKIIGNNWSAQIRNDAGTVSSSYIGSIPVSATRTDAVTLLRSGDNYPLYVNGVNAGSAVLSGNNTAGPFQLGYAGNGSSQQMYFVEALFFSSALSSTNLSVLYASQSSAFKVVSSGTGKLLDAYAANGPLNAVSASSGGANTSVAIAYSVRQLKTSYEHTAITPPTAVSGFTNSSAPLIRVRRSSDNNQLDIGYDANGYLDTTTLKSFTGAGSGFINVWYDQSGNSRDASQSTQASQPRIVNAGVVERNVNGAVSVVDQNGLFVDNTNAYSITGDRTVNIVVQPKVWTNGSLAAGDGSYLVDRSTVGNIGLSCIKVVSDKWTAQIRSDGDAATISQSYSGNSYASLSATRADAVSLLRKANDYMLYVNATFTGSGTISGVNTLEGFRMGYGTNTSQNMYFNEVIYFASALSTSDRSSLQRSQNIFLGKPITASLLDPPAGGGPVSAVLETPTSATLSNTSLSLAYSMRLLKTGYEHTAITPPATVSGFTNSTTPLIRVKRATDNQLLDIGYTSSGMLDTVTLKNFVSNNGALTTNNGFLDTWYDQSGNSLDARATVAGYEPLVVNAGVVQRNVNGLISVANTVQRFTCNTAVNVSGDRTIIMVAQPSAYTNGALTSGAGTYLNDRNSHTDNSLSSVKLSNGKWSTQLRNSDGSGLASSYEGSIAVSNNRIDAVALLRSGNDYPLYVNGIQSGTVNLAGTNTLNSFQLGYRYDLSSDNQYVYFNEVLVFPSALSTSDQDAVFSSQNTIFNLASYTWTGATSSDWNTASNWSPEGIPNEASSVIIPSSGVTNALSITVAQTTLKVKKFTAYSGSTVTINGNLSVSDSATINGSSGGTGTVTLTGSLPQYIKGAFPGLINNNTERVNAYGNVTVSGTLTNSSNGIMNMGVNTLGGSPTVTNNGVVLTQNTSSAPFPSGKTWSGSGSGSVTYNTTSGGQTVMSGTYGNLTLANATGTQTAEGTVTLNNTLSIVAGSTLNMATFALAGSLTSISNSGTIKTASTVNPALPTDKTWSGAVEYNAVSGGQYVANGTYNNLTTGNTSGIQTATGNITISNGGTLTTTVGGTLSMATGLLAESGTATFTNSGTIATANTSATPLPLSKTWGGTVQYNNAVGGQTVVTATYTGLDVSNTSGTNTAGGFVAVTNVFVTSSGGTLDMGTNTLQGPMSTSITVNGTVRTARATVGGFPNGKIWAGTGTIEYYLAMGGQFIATGTFNNLTLSNTSGTQTANGNIVVNGTLTIAAGGTMEMGTSVLSGTLATITSAGTIRTSNTSSAPIASGKTWTGTVTYNATTGSQTVVGGSYTNLTMGNTNGAQTAGGAIAVSGTFINPSGSTLNMGTNAMTGSTATISNSGTITTANTSTTPALPDNKTWGGIVMYNASAGTQHVAGGTYNNLTLSNTSGTKTAESNITMSNGGTLTTTAGGILSMGSNALSESGTATFTNNGTITTANTSATPIPSGKTWGGTVIFNALTGGQTVVTGPYNNLTTGNTSGAQTAAGNLVVNGTFTTTAGGTLSMGGSSLSGTLSTINNNGILTTANTSPTPFPSGRTWGGTVEYMNPVGIQSVMTGTYNDLGILNTSGVQVPSGTLTVNGTLTTATGATLDMWMHQLQGTLFAVNNNGTISTASLANPPIPVGKTWDGLVNYSLPSGGQVVSSGTYNNLSFLNSQAQQFANGDLTVNGILETTSDGSLNMGIYALNGSLTSINNNGNIRTSNTSSAPIPSGKSWNGRVVYDLATGGQTVVAGTYNNVAFSNTSGTQSLNGNATINGLMAMSGGTLTLGSNTLTINGTISGLSANGSLVANGSSNLSIGGSGTLGSNLFFNQAIPGTSNRLNNLTYNRTSQSITLGNPLQVAGMITPSAGTLATNDMLTLISNATGTAMIAAGSGTYITGNVTAERYVPSIARRWRFLASPVSGATLDDWQNEIFITGTGGAANGFDATPSNAAGAYSYNETTTGDMNTGWEAASTINTPLTPGKGFRVFIRGDRSDPNVLNGNTGSQAAVTLNTIGPVNTNDIAMPVSYTNTGSTINDGWNLLGNPYPSAIDWNVFHDAGRTGSAPDYSGTDYTHLDPVISVYDATNSNYASFNAVSNIGTGALSNGVLPLASAFWVITRGASPSMTMKEIYKTAATPAPMFKSEILESAFTLRLSKDAITADEIVVKYMNEANKNFDSYDIAKLNGEVNISSITEDHTFLTGNCKPFNGISDTIRLNVTTATSGSYLFTAKHVQQLTAIHDVHLVDALTHTLVNLNTTPGYRFDIDTNNPSTYGSGRFMIVVGKPGETTGTEEQSVTSNIFIYPSFTTGEVTISSMAPINEAATIAITDATGRLITTLDNMQWNNNRIGLDLSAYKAGAYVITITTATHNAVFKCIKY
jgi:hypothetical protein